MDNKTKAKAVKIETLYKGELRQFGQVLRGLCPFHKDTGTPNFTIYPATNTYNCFAGCGWGDSIAFYMKTHKVDFKTAIKELIKIK